MNTREKTVDAIRTIDEIGRVIIPKSVRDYLGIVPGDKFEIVINNGSIVFARHESVCLACNEDTDVQRFNKTFLCGECRDALVKAM
ncbi:MAG: AbrB/MazE/SpoVT family DNA-binding domain-containing protein [Defluviitaleaceae bacterium]|nr:AbrB/MazE/SpoVT family DNA-binding domain-containing protein [Defluviitaleaceae bacterium]